MKRSAAHDWSPILAAERPVERFSPPGRYRLALAYANTYHVAMSSLGFQRVYELVHRTPEWTAERFFTDGVGMPISVETGRPMNDFGCVAFSVSFEEDYVNLLQMLGRARIPLRRKDRGPWDPVIVMGGSCASINPLPMSEFVDVFAIGAAENVLPDLLAALQEEEEREAVIERLAARDGFYVPTFHHHEEEGDALPKLNKRELTEEQMKAPGHLPTTAIVTPHIEFSEKFLIEMSRGCPEKCRYCWASFGMGRFRWHPTEYILASLERARPVTDQLGFVATAVGDHPDIEKSYPPPNVARYKTPPAPFNPARYADYVIAREQLMVDILKVMADHKLDAIVHKTVEHQPALIKEGINPPYTSARGVPTWNTFLIYAASMTVPSGFDSDNLPVGITFFGRPYSEPVLLKLAYSYEQATRHRRPPSSTPPLP